MVTMVPREMPLRLEGLGEFEPGVADGDDDAGGHGHQVDRVGEVDAVLLPDFGTEQADHPVQNHRDPPQHAAGRGRDQRAELGREPESDREQAAT